MFKECRHILPTGFKCKSPALRDQHFCYFHNTARRFAAVSTTSAEPLLFPSIEDTGGVQIALNQVLRGLGARRIDPRHAGLFFYGLQIASKLARKSEGKLSEAVRELCEEEDGLGNLAPEKSTCEPPADCVNCRRRDFCANFPLYRSKVEKLEDRLEAEREAAEEEAEEQEEQEEQPQEQAEEEPEDAD
ncbi:hypothetical protein P8935_00025 [Telmatobacter sp. DSM 110680]|uniref:PD-(D/E)XK endonuclease-like domain-containing protein n=1 Tax=Telmatobacter sp. DSM 110680 TaxID=3036704 RepID=A0AAU7DIR4_9BACT